MKFKQGRISLDFKLQKNDCFLKYEEKNSGEDKRKISPSRNISNKMDPRPLFDKNYISNCIRDIVFFLSKKGYDVNFSQNLLKYPVSKDFFNILSFLLNQFDKHFDFKKKIEETYTLILKEISYPFTLPKGTRYIIGSPHLWPNLLACLKWLVELLQYDSLMRDEIGQKQKDSKKKQKNIWEQLSDSYFYFLNASGENKNFSKTIYCLVKLKINEDRIYNFQKIKKLRAKYRNFQGAKNAFILFLIFDKIEILNKKTFFDFDNFLPIFLIFFFNENSDINNFFLLRRRKSIIFLNSKSHKRKNFEKSFMSFLNRGSFFFFLKKFNQKISLQKVLVKMSRKVQKFIYFYKRIGCLTSHFIKNIKNFSRKKILSSFRNERAFSYNIIDYQNYITRKFYEIKEENFFKKIIQLNLIFYKIKKIKIIFLFDFLEKKIFVKRKYDRQRNLNFSKKNKNFRRIKIEEKKKKKFLKLDIFETKKNFYFKIICPKLKKIKNIIFKKHLTNNLIFQIFSVITYHILKFTNFFLSCLF